jgi:glucosylglycerate phosphorylase
MTHKNTAQKEEEGILEKLTFVYGKEKAETIYEQIVKLIEKYKGEIRKPKKAWVDEKDVMLITYGDSIKEDGKAPLQSLHEFLVEHVSDVINAVHILPFYPYSSDDGFSVIDYTKVNPDLGEWEHIHQLSADFDLMFDAVINHISQHSEWFQEYLKGNPEYERFFIEADPNADYSTVVRPRALPLLTKFETKKGPKYIWTTFSDDQIDLNYENETVLLAILEILLTYVKHGARFLRLDAIGFLWKRIGTACIHLEETHALVQVMRQVLEAVAPGVIIITETNVPHKDNISYFGNGYNEAHLVYQFPLPPLTLYTFYTGNAKYLLEWADSLEPTTEKTTFFNFLASHDGIGVRPVEGILAAEQVQMMINKVKEHGGFVSYKDNGDGTQSPYELNINYLDALSHPNDDNELKAARFIAAHSILLSMMGMPGIYIHSLLGSRNDLKGVEQTGRYRSINREKLQRDEVEQQLSNPDSLRYQVFKQLKRLLKIRTAEAAFHPNAPQKVLFLDERVFSLQRTSRDGKENIISLVNVSNKHVSLQFNVNELGGHSPIQFIDLVTKERVGIKEGNVSVLLQPYQVMWLKAE